MDEPTCQATRYDPRPCTETPPRWRVVWRTQDRSKVLDQHPACFLHGLAEVERHHRSAGIAACDLEESA